LTIRLNGINADDDVALVLFGWRLVGINWDVDEVYSGARGVDVGGKRVIGIGICTGSCDWDEYWFGIEDEVGLKWSDKWDVPSGETIGKLLD